MIFRIFWNRMVFTLSGVPIAFACSGFILFPLHLKPIAERSEFERTWVGGDEETHQCAVSRNYVCFVQKRMQAGIPSAIGGGLAVSGVDILAYKKKKQEEEEDLNGDK